MFNIKFKRWGSVGLVAAAWLAAEAFSASAQVNMNAQRRNLTRSHMFSSFANNGSFGQSMRINAERMFNHTYPGIGAGACGVPREDWYWTLKPSGWCGGHEAPALSLSRAYVTLTTVGGEKYASYGPFRGGTEDVSPRIYDIENGPEATWGLNTKAPARSTSPGANTSNWWPGAMSLINNQPVNTQPYEIHNYDYGVYPPVQNTAETIMISEWSSNEHAGANVLAAVRRVLGWSNQDLDDMLVYDTEWTNTSNQQITDAWFGFIQQLHLKGNGQQARGSYHYGWHNYDDTGVTEFDDVFTWSEDPNFSGDPNFIGNFWVVQYDGNDPLSPDDDTGDPFWLNLCWDRACTNPGFLNATARPDGMPLSPDYIGLGPLAWRSSGTGAWNAKDAAVGYVEAQGAPLYHYWPLDRSRSYVDPAGSLESGVGTGPATHAGKYAAWTEGGSHTPPTEPASGGSDILFGPYTLDPGDKVKLVLAQVAGLGAHITTNPDNGYPLDPIDWAWQIGEQYASQTDAPARNAELAKGWQGLWTNIMHAQFAYSNEWQVPTTPPDVDFGIRSNLNAQTQLTWNGDAENAVNPDYGEADVTAYRVYVSDWSEAGPWKLKGTVPAGQSSYTWADEGSLAGFSAFYNVRSVASAKSSWSEGTKTLADLPAQMAAHVTSGLEGGYSSPEQREFKNITPSQPADPKSDNLELEVRVVPNPLNISEASQNYNGEIKMRFVGIPSRAKISIYSVGGDLVSTVYHNNPNSGEAEFRLLNSTVSGQIFSGVYIWVVESLPSRGKTKSGYLVIHR